MWIKSFIWFVEYINVWTVGSVPLNIIIIFLSEERHTQYYVLVTWLPSEDETLERTGRLPS